MRRCIRHLEVDLWARGTTPTWSSTAKRQQPNAERVHRIPTLSQCATVLYTGDIESLSKTMIQPTQQYEVSWHKLKNAGQSISQSRSDSHGDTHLKKREKIIDKGNVFVVTVGGTLCLATSILRGAPAKTWQFYYPQHWGWAYIKYVLRDEETKYKCCLFVGVSAFWIIGRCIWKKNVCLFWRAFRFTLHLFTYFRRAPQLGPLCLILLSAPSIHLQSRASLMMPTMVQMWSEMVDVGPFQGPTSKNPRQDSLPLHFHKTLGDSWR